MSLKMPKIEILVADLFNANGNQLRAGITRRSLGNCSGFVGSCPFRIRLLFLVLLALTVVGAADMLVSKSSASDAVYLSLRTPHAVTYFKVPSVFLTTEENLRGGEQQTLVIRASLPRMAPWSTIRSRGLTRPQADDDADKRPNRLQEAVPTPVEFTIIVLRGRPFAVREMRHRVRAETTPEERGLRFGLESRVFVPEYEGQFSNGIVAIDAVYFIPTTDFSNNSQYFECFLGRLSGKCRGNGNYSSALYYRYYFDEEYFRYWGEIDNLVRTLLEGFEVRAIPSLEDG